MDNRREPVHAFNEMEKIRPTRSLLYGNCTTGPPNNWRKNHIFSEELQLQDEETVELKYNQFANLSKIMDNLKLTLTLIQRSASYSQMATPGSSVGLSST